MRDDVCMNQNRWAMTIDYPTNNNLTVERKRALVTVLTDKQIDQVNSIANHLPCTWKFESPTLILLMKS